MRCCQTKPNKNELYVVVVLVEVGVAQMEKSIDWTCLEDVIIKSKTAQT